MTANGDMGKLADLAFLQIEMTRQATESAAELRKQLDLATECMHRDAERLAALEAQNAAMKRVMFDLHVAVIGLERFASMSIGPNGRPAAANIVQQATRAQRQYDELCAWLKEVQRRRSILSGQLETQKEER